MIDPRLNDIIKNKRPCYFISPHLDDAALSAGELIRFLASKISVTVINVFTQAGSGPQTLSAQRYIKLSGYSDAPNLFSDRVSEDGKALKSLGVKVINLKYTDALWRRLPNSSKWRKLLGLFLPEADHVYPTYRFHVITGCVSPQDGKLMVDFSRHLGQLIKPNSVVFCPLGVGNHVDHCLTRKVVENKFSPIYWLDQPYSFRKNQILNPNRFASFNYPVNDIRKSQLIHRYKSQVNQLFTSGKVPHLQEKFYYHE